MSRARREQAERSGTWPMPLFRIQNPIRSVLGADREENPTRNQWIAGAVILGALGIGTYAVLEARKPSHKLPPMPPEGSIGPGQPCDLGEAYPGFIYDGVECLPTADTPPGIYIIDDCNDFIYVPGDDGPQPDYLEARISQAAAGSATGIHGVTPGAGFDPTIIVTQYLHKFWPECPWPPAPDAAERIVQLYMVLTVLVGRTIVLHGGKVLGHADFDGADEAIGDRLVAMGFAEFKPEVVSEIHLPEPPAGGGLGKQGAAATEIEMIKQKICNAPGSLTALEKIAYTNAVLSPVLDTRVKLIGKHPTYAQLSNMFSSIAHHVLLYCPADHRAPAVEIATKLTKYLWAERYNGGQIPQAPAPPQPPPNQGGGGIKPPPLPACAVEPYERLESPALPQVSWTNRKVHEFKVFEFIGKWAACNDYDLLVGVCVQVPADNPYGLLSQYIADPSIDFSLGKVRLRNGLPPALGDDGGGGAVPWNSFAAPPCWKKQLSVRVRKVTGTQVYAEIGGAASTHDITGSQAGHTVDRCPDLAVHWPISQDEIFGVQAWDGKWYPWQSIPKVELYTQGLAVFVRVTYVGVPNFAWNDDHNDARAQFSLTDPVLKIRSVATGRTP